MSIEFAKHSKKKMAKMAMAHLEGMGIVDVDIARELFIRSLRKLDKTDRAIAIKQFNKEIERTPYPHEDAIAHPNQEVDDE